MKNKKANKRKRAKVRKPLIMPPGPPPYPAFPKEEGALIRPLRVITLDPLVVEDMQTLERETFVDKSHIEKPDPSQPVKSIAFWMLIVMFLTGGAIGYIGGQKYPVLTESPLPQHASAAPLITTITKNGICTAYVTQDGHTTERNCRCSDFGLKYPCDGDGV